MTTSAAATAKSEADSARLQAPILTDGQWAVVEPFLDQGRPTGRPPKWPVRLVLEAVLFVLRTGCQWHMLPAAYPPRTTVHWWFMRWARLGTIDRMNHALVMADRERRGRDASPTAAVVDAQTVRTSASARFSGYDAGKRTVGVKRHGMVDTDGRLLALGLSKADVHDGAAAVPLLLHSRPFWPFVDRVFADAAYRGRRVAFATPIDVDVVTGPPNQRGFVVQRRRWVVERTWAWLGNCRRLARNYERLAETAAAFVVLAAAMILVRRLAAASTE